MPRTFTSAAIATGLMLLAAPAAADAPAVVPVQGTLSDADGVPIDRRVTILVTVYDAPEDGAVLHQETAEIAVDRGSFVFYLGSVEPLDLAVFRDVGTTFLGLQIGDDAEMRPRLELGSAPYAAFSQWAGDAETLGGQPGTDFASAGHGHDWGELTGVPAGIADGDDNTTYDGGDFATSDQSCAPGNVVDGIDTAGAITCTPDRNTTYDGSDFATSNQSCFPGRVVTGINANGGISCAPDANTTYDGGDFALSGQTCGSGQRVIGISGTGNVVCQSVTSRSAPPTAASAARTTVTSRRAETTRTTSTSARSARARPERTPTPWTSARSRRARPAPAPWT